MNYPLLRYLFGMILLIVAAFLVLPLAVAVIYGESSGIYFLYTMIAAGLLGFLLTRFKPAKRDMYAREGFVFTALAWVVISLIGAAPFTLSGQIPSYLDAVFETVSGFTTTGASILTTWRRWTTGCSSGAASPTGWGAWAFWCSCCRW